MARGRAGNPHARRWLGRRWTSWTLLAEVLQKGAIPDQPGVYRLRGRRSKGLLYVGETEGLRGRLGDLRRALGKAATGLNKDTGHWAAPNLHARLKGRQPELSWLRDPIPLKAERKGIECECIAAHRWHLDRNPDCQVVSFEK